MCKRRLFQQNHIKGMRIKMLYCLGGVAREYVGISLIPTQRISRHPRFPADWQIGEQGRL